MKVVTFSPVLQSQGVAAVMVDVSGRVMLQRTQTGGGVYEALQESGIQYSGCGEITVVPGVGQTVGL